MRRAVLVLALLAACRAPSKTFGPSEPRHSKDTVILANGSEPRSIDPALGEEAAGIEIIQNCFEGLTSFDPKSPLSPRPGIASSWEILDGGRRYIFHLRDSTWDDGTPLMAADFVYSWQRALLPATASQYAYQLWPITGAKAFNDGTLTDPAKLGFRAIDPHTLEVTLDQPTPFFLYVATLPVMSPVPRHTVERWGRLWTTPEHIVGNGAYKLVHWVLQDEIVLERNDRYWDRAHVKIRKVVVLADDNTSSIMNLYRTGELDTTEPNSRPPLVAVPDLRHYADYSEQPYLATYFYSFNCTKKPFDDVRVRLAFDRALDKKRLNDSLLFGMHIPTWSVVPDLLRSITGYVPPVGPNDRYDPEAARKLLAAAGYPGGKGFPVVQLMFNPEDQHRLIAEAAQAMWRDTLGVQVEIRNIDWKQLRADVAAGNYDIARSGWQADFPEPSTFLSTFYSDAGQNDSFWKSAEFDKALGAALAENNPAKRNALYAKAERIVLDGMPVLPVYVYGNNMLVAPKLHGFEQNILNVHLYKDLWWE